ncbi:hypothetical protein MMC19_007778 [Ptychographa xylographoides]|nr:hypothetical protein [Ptychographa xylographoides]
MIGTDLFFAVLSEGCAARVAIAQKVAHHVLGLRAHVGNGADCRRAVPQQKPAAAGPPAEASQQPQADRHHKTPSQQEGRDAAAGAWPPRLADGQAEKEGAAQRERLPNTEAYRRRLHPLVLNAGRIRCAENNPAAPGLNSVRAGNGSLIANRRLPREQDMSGKCAFRR